MQRRSGAQITDRSEGEDGLGRMVKGLGMLGLLLGLDQLALSSQQHWSVGASVLGHQWQSYRGKGERTRQMDRAVCAAGKDALLALSRHEVVRFIGRDTHETI